MNENQATGVRKVSLLFAFMLFGVPGAAIYLGVHYLVPTLIQNGVSLVFAWTFAVVGPTVANAVFVLTYYYFTERPSLQQFAIRFRLTRPDRRIWWLVPLTGLAIVAGNELLAWTVPLLASIDILAPPLIIPEIFANVYESLNQGMANTTFMGEVVTPQKLWLVPFWLFFWVFLAVCGEEIVWRGYIMPAHEAQFGQAAWIINALLWNLPFHLYTIHNAVSDLPLFFLLPFLVYKQKNTWFGIAVHALLVSLALFILIPGLM